MISYPFHQNSDNPLLLDKGLPAFSAIRPEHVVPAVTQLSQWIKSQIATMEQGVKPTWEALMGELDLIDRAKHRVWNTVGHLQGVGNTPELRAAHEQALPLMVEVELLLGQNKAIYEALVKLRDTEGDKLSGPKKRGLEAILKQFELSGVALEGAAKERYNAIVHELSDLSTRYANNSLDATKAYALDLTKVEDVAGLTESDKAMYAAQWSDAHKDQGKQASAENGPWRVTLTAASFLQFMKNSSRSDLRKELYYAYTCRASNGEINNTPILQKIVALKQESAKLLGFENYAQLSLSQKMARQPETALELMERISTYAKPAAVKEFQELTNFAKSKGHTGELFAWDITYFSERMREEKFSYTNEEVKRYFPFESVLEGMLTLTNRLFSVSFEDATSQVERWHEDVRYYHVKNEKGKVIAGFYLDPFARPATKRSGAWMDIAQQRRIYQGELEIPVAFLACNGAAPVGGKPSLMTYEEVTTLFHEFGHGLQLMLTEVDEGSVSGLSNVEWDAVEIASQFMENWCYHYPVVKGMSRHIETGEPLPKALFDRIDAAQNFNAGIALARQLAFGFTDFAIYNSQEAKSGEELHKLFNQISTELQPFPPPAENRFLCQFAHIFAGGYSAGYYSYLWSEALSADAFAAFEEVGLDNETALKEVGQRYRSTILGQGGGKHPAQVFREFRGRDVDVKALIKSYGFETAEA